MPTAARGRRNQIRGLSPSWARYLRANQKSKATISNYLYTLGQLSVFLDERQLPAGVKTVKAEHIQEFLDAVRERTSGNNAQFHYRNLLAFYAWIIQEEGMIAGDRNPLKRVARPRGEPVARPAFTEEQIAALLRSCSGRRFHDRRDAAIIRLFLDTGVRVGGLVGMMYDPVHTNLDNPGKNDVFQDAPTPLVRFRLKGGKPHMVDITRKTALALDRYVRARDLHPHAGLPNLWLGSRGALKKSGVHDMLSRRAEQAGLETRVHAHRFRHTMPTWSLEAGMSRDTIKARAGWSSDAMLNQYVSDSVQSRAWAESQQAGVADRV